MKKAVFLDRDGTINKDKGYVHLREDFELLPGAIDGLRLLQEKGYLLILITNQSGIGRGFFTEDEYLDFQDWVAELLKEQGVRLTAQYYCPHVDEDSCQCRKPGIELFERAQKEFDIDWASSWAIGDRKRDLSICDYQEVRGILLPGQDDGAELENPNIVRADSLCEAAKIIGG